MRVKGTILSVVNSSIIDVVYRILTRQQTHTGRPSGTQTFLESLENLLQRNVRPQKRGPKPRNSDDDE